MPTADWKRAGEMLVRRRIELDPRYTNRHTFAAERGINYRIASDLEAGRRGNYEKATLAAAEVAYGLAPGSIARAAAGGELEPAPGTGRDSAGQPSGPPPGILPPVPSVVARSLFPGDRTKQLIWDLDEDDEAKAALVRTLDEWRRNPGGQESSRNVG